MHLWKKLILKKKKNRRQHKVKTYNCKLFYLWRDSCQPSTYNSAYWNFHIDAWTSHIGNTRKKRGMGLYCQLTRTPGCCLFQWPVVVSICTESNAQCSGATIEATTRMQMHSLASIHLLDESFSWKYYCCLFNIFRNQYTIMCLYRCVMHK